MTVGLRDVLIRIDAFAQPAKTQSTSLLRAEAFKRAMAATEGYLGSISAIQTKAVVKDVRAAQDGVVEVQISGLNDTQYADSQVKALYCSEASNWRMRMDADTARQLKPGTLMVIVGKPRFVSGKMLGWGVSGTQGIVGMQVLGGGTLGYIAMSDYKIQIGRLTFDSPYAGQ